MDDTPNIAIFCDFENVAIGARDAGFEHFEIGMVTERLLEKGHVVVKKAYCDWARYKDAKRPMHEAGFELIEIPHVSYSGKNSADIRLVVDALDLCYTKPHVGAFVIVSGDSDFSPLAGKLRENAKAVIGVGVKNSSGDLLVESCDEFIFYDDLVRARRRTAKSHRNKPAQPGKADRKDKSDKGEDKDKDKDRGNKEEAFELVVDIVEALFRERDDVWGSMVKQTIKRKRPQFSESYYGYRSFNQLLDDARKAGLLEMTKDAKSGGYIITGFGPEA